MLKVLIIDDEKLVRQMIMRCIDWKSIDLNIIGEASSARMGLEMIETHHPDLVFMDVRMPGMDGLSCSRQVVEKYPNIKIIIVSGHGEFEYASEGLRIGVFDYLLKPIDAEELRRAAIKARDTILAEQRNSEEMLRLREELERHSAYIRDRQLGALVRGRYSKQLLNTLEYFGVSFETQTFQVAIVGVDVQNMEDSDDVQLLVRMQTKQLVEDFFGEQRDGVYVFDSGTEGIVVINNADDELFYRDAEKLRRYLTGNIEGSVTIGVGNAYEELKMIPESYREAKDALRYCFVTGTNAPLFFRDIYPFYDYIIGLPEKAELLHEIGNALRVGNSKRAVELNSALADIFRRPDGNREQTLVACFQVLAEVMRCLLELRMDQDESGFVIQNEIEQIQALHNLEQIKAYMNDMLLRVCNVISNRLQGKEKDLIYQVREYLQEHYSDETISLAGIAEKLYVNPSYLSRIFKEKMDKNFSATLFEIRMEEAVRLVLASEQKVYEIGERVGIPDPHYFSSCFKKYTGLSVSEYRKKYM